VHMCVPTTPPALTFHYCVAKSNEKSEHKMPKNSEEFQRKSKPGGLNQAGRPEIF